MIFSSVEFLLYFLPIFLIVYGLTPRRFQNFVLLVGSLIFYAMGEPDYLLLLLASVILNYFAGRFLGVGEAFRRRWNRTRDPEELELWRKAVLLFAVTINVGVLLLFKVAIGGESMPLGVSFYTFQILSYLIDVYRGEIPSERSMVRLATYVTMFPQLVSGPIVNFDEVSESLHKRRMTWKSLQNGLKLFTIGLVYKVLLADNIGTLWNDLQMRGFESISTPLSWVGAIGFSFKLYFDFLGYSLMAIGLGVIMGFKFPENFNHPYMARSVREFYRRWHITLGRWFSKYIYIPMGGNRNGEFCTARNLLVVWALTGLWHGGKGTFILWGIVLWAIILTERLVGRFLDKHPIGEGSICSQMHVLPHLYLWFIIPVTWMCFAITDVNQLWIYLGRMFGVAPQHPALEGDWKMALATYGWLLGICFVASTPILKRIYHRWKDSLVMNAVLAVLFWFCVWRVIVAGNNPFMYFKF